MTACLARAAEGTPPPAGTAYLRATGGTTGAPRLIAFDEMGAAAGSRAPAVHIGVEPGAFLAITASPWSGYGWNNWCAFLTHGGAVRHLSALAPRELLAALREPGAVGFTTPEVVRALARLGGVEGPATRLFVGAAAYPLAAGIEAQRRHGIVPLEVYGATEAGPEELAQVACVPAGRVSPRGAGITLGSSTGSRSANRS